MYIQNPFGNPDGARANLKEIEYSFITDFPYGKQVSQCQDELLNKRVIVGAKGSGKTVYLRKIQSILKNKQEDRKSGIYVDEIIDQNMNCTESVIRFCDFYSKDMLSEKWTQAWKVAILLMLTHKFMFDGKLNAYMEEVEVNQIQKMLKNEKLLFSEPMSVYQFMTLVLESENTMNKMNSLLNNNCWTQLTFKMKKLIRNAPTIYVFLDAIDLEYEHAPLHWVYCQKGLFYALMTYLQDNILGEKLHLIISLRDNVFTSILRSEQATKFARESHIFTLDWDERNIKVFLEQKVEKLNDCYFLNLDNMQKNIVSWLGCDEIINENGEMEKVIDFVIRHTRNVPRDIINICNVLAGLLVEIEHNKSLVKAEWIKRMVLKESATIGDELITICAKNIKVNLMPRNAAQYGIIDCYTSDKYYERGSFTKLFEILEICKNKKINWDIVKEMDSEANKVFNHDVHLSDILWQNGALGYIDDLGKKHFYAQKFSGDILLPQRKCEYLLRPCVLVRLCV